jgi:hypothetical protein
MKKIKNILQDVASPTTTLFVFFLLFALVVFEVQKNGITKDLLFWLKATVIPYIWVVFLTRKYLSND